MHTIFAVIALAFIPAALYGWLAAGRSFKKGAIIGVLATGVLFPLALLATPTLGTWFAGTWSFGVLSAGLGWLLALIPALSNTDGDPEDGNWALLCCGTLVLIALGLGFISSAEMFHAQRYHDLLVVKEAAVEDIPAVETKRIRLVPKEAALTAAGRVLSASHNGQLLSTFLELDKARATLQEVGGVETWVIPIDYRGLTAWWRLGSIPGYVRVNAQDPNQPAELVTTDNSGKPLAIEFTPGAFFVDNLERKVWLVFGANDRRGWAFEIDEEGRPYYTVALTTPSIGFDGDEITDVLTIDAQSGKLTPHEPGDAPEWLDNAVPVVIAKERLAWWGAYGNPSMTWYHGAISGNNKLVASGDDLWSIHQGEGRAWFTGMTSATGSDRSLVGLVLIDCRTGVATRFNATGSADEEGLEERIHNALGANADRWHSTEPLPYRIGGELTWVTPILGKDGSPQGVALARMTNINTLVIEPNLAKAIAAYQGALRQDGIATVATELAEELSTATGRVIRRGVRPIDGKIFVELDSAPGTYFGATGEGVETFALVMATVGDRLAIRYSGEAPLYDAIVVGQ